jgi:hypothetical protein
LSFRHSSSTSIIAWETSKMNRRWKVHKRHVREREMQKEGKREDTRIEVVG